MNQAVRILVADDDPDILFGTARALTKAGYTVEQASNGADALRAVQDRRPDLVLSDRDMPVMDGIELCRRIKQDPVLKGILVVIASGSFTQSDAQSEGLEAGADGYIARPITNRELLARVESYVRIIGSTRSLQIQAEQLKKSSDVAASSLRLKLVLTFAALIAILLGIGGLGLSELASVNEKFQENTKRWRHVELSREGLRYSALNSRITMQIFLLQDRKAIDALLEQRAANTGRISELIKEIKAGVDSDSAKALLARVDSTRSLYIESYLLALNLLLEKGQPEAGRNMMIDAVTPKLVAYHNAWEEFVTDQAQRVNHSADLSEANYFAVRVKLLALLALAVFLACAIAVYAIRTSSREITNRMHAEEGLREAQTTLERRVEERTVQLRRAEESHARLAMAVEQSAETIVITDTNGTIIYANPAFEKSTGYSRAEAMGQNPRVLKSGKHDAEYYRQMWDVLTSGEVWHGHFSNKRKDGTLYEEDATISPIRDASGKVVNFVAVKRDVTREVELQELRKLTMQELERSKESAEAANTAKSTFLANMSHELRTPLNAVIGYSEMLEEMATDDGNSDYVPDLQKIRAAGKHLLELINSVLDLSKIEAGKMDLYIENFALAPLLNDVAAMIEPLIAKNNNTLKLSCALDLHDMSADVTKLRQTLFNLLSNASKFTAIGIIRLSAGKETTEGKDWVVIEIKDSGIGMTPEQLAKLFQPFQQADASTTRKYGGTGLGLTISRKFCQMMGGDLTVASEFGSGTTFTVRLPLVQKTPVSVRAPKSVRLALPHLRTQVLLIDDDPVIHDLITHNLSKSGCDVHSARNGAEGLQLARSMKPDVIILDVMMQQTDGWSVLNTLKNDPELRSIPVIMQSMLTDRGMGFALGASDYLIKPVSNSQLLRSVNKYRKEKLAGSVLVVDDDPDLRERLSNQLLKQGLVPILAENGKQGIRMLEEHEITFIFTDLMMPEMDGMAFINTVHANPLWKDIPIVVMTAKELNAEERKTLGLAAQLVLEKHAMSYTDLFQYIGALITDNAPVAGKAASAEKETKPC